MSKEEIDGEDGQINLEVSAQIDQAIDCLETSDPKALKYVKKYFSYLIENLKVFDISEREKVTTDLFFERAKQMLSIRDNSVRLMIAIAEFEEQEKFYSEIHSLFERLIEYFSFSDAGDSYEHMASDHYKVFGYELFLYTVAALLKFGRFEQLNELTQQGYYIPATSYFPRNSKFIDFGEFNQKISALNGNNWDEQNQAKITFLKERLLTNNFSMEDLAQADFVLYFISLLDGREKEVFFYGIWFNQIPTKLHTFELFVRSESKRFFDKFSNCLRRVSKEEISNFLELFYKKVSESNLRYRQFDLEEKIALKKIATRF